MVNKNPNKQKIMVEQSKMSSSTFIPYKLLYSEVVANETIAKERVKELKEEYKDTEALCIHYFSL